MRRTCVPNFRKLRTVPIAKAFFLQPVLVFREKNWNLEINLKTLGAITSDRSERSFY